VIVSAFLLRISGNQKSSLDNLKAEDHVRTKYKREFVCLLVSFLIVHKSRSRYNAAAGVNLVQPTEER
jgi:hypothetical protein